MIVKLLLFLNIILIVNSSVEEEAEFCPEFDSYKRPLKITTETCRNMSSYGFELPPIFNNFIYDKHGFEFQVSKDETTSSNDTCLLNFSISIDNCSVVVDPSTELEVGTALYLSISQSEGHMNVETYSPTNTTRIRQNSSECNGDWLTKKYFHLVLTSNLPSNESSCVFTPNTEDFSLLHYYNETIDTSNQVVIVDDDDDIFDLDSWIKAFECKRYCFLVAVGQVIVLILFFGIFLIGLCMVLRLKRDLDSAGWIYRAEEAKRLHKEQQSAKEKEKLKKKKKMEMKNEKKTEKDNKESSKIDSQEQKSGGEDDETVLDSRLLEKR